MTISNIFMSITKHKKNNTRKHTTVTILFIFLILAIILIVDQNLKFKHIQYINSYAENEYIEYTDKVEFLAFSTLIAFPEKAFTKNNSNEYENTKLTINEFKNILEQLYLNDYIIVDIEDIYKYENNRITKQKLFLPKNKKPIVLTFNNVAYKSSYQNIGEIDKIIIDRNNELASYTTKKSIQDRVQYDNEFILILENYLTKHPDFHLGNAKGIIFCTGENGILGYNTCHNYASSKNELKRVTALINKMKKMGWKFGSNNYRYLSQKEMSELEFAKDISLWNNEIKPAIKNTNLFAYPYGEYDENKTRLEILLCNEFNIFFVNNNYVVDNNYRDYVIIPQIYINSDTLKNKEETIKHLFNPETVYDANSRII